jgi:DNA-binding SARP family transcriptional activator
VGLEINLLGRPAVRRDGVEAAAPRGHKVWALLAYLVLADRPVARTRVAAVLFPDANDPLAAVRWNLHELRRLLGPDAGVRGDPITVELPPDAGLDVTKLRSGSWRQAVLLADPDAELLEGLTFAGCPGLEAWLVAQRRHLRSVAEEVLHESVLARLAAGQLDQALATAATLAGSNPYRESLQELYVRCLLASGDVAGANRQRQAAVDAIRRDLGVSPGAGLLMACSPVPDGDAAASAADIKAWFTLGLVWLHAGSYDAALAVMRKSVAAARHRGDYAVLLRALLVLGYGLAVSSLGGGAEAATVQHEAIALAARLGDERLLGAAELQYALTELLRGQYSRARHWADLAASRSAADPVQMSRVRTIRGTALVDVGRPADGIEELRAALTVAPIHADPRNAAYALSMFGKAQLLRGDLGAAATTLDQAIHLARVHWIAFRPWPESLRAEVALACGQLERAEQMFQQAHTLARNFDHSPCWESAAARGLGLVAAAKGAVDEAVTWFDDAYRHLHRRSVTYEWVHCNALDSLCDVGVAHGLPGAAGWIDELEERAGRLGMHAFLVRSFQHRDRLGHADAGATAALLDPDGTRLSRSWTPPVDPATAGVQGREVVR